MDCANCGRANRAGAKFCGGCGKPLAPRCPACGSETQPDSQFCDACGASLVASPAGASEARKIVTIVFADLIGSTALHERLDAESARRFMERYYRAMRAAVESFGGTVTQLLGDGVKAVFGAPRVAEDDAIRAVRAAVEMQRAFRELAEEQLAAVGQTGLRVAVNTGEVVANDATEIIGDPVNVAARLQEEARDGGVVIGEATRRLVADLVTLAPLGNFSLKGRSEAVAAYRVVSLERPAGAAAIAFVGREDELRRITAVFDAAVAKPAARLAVLLGSPGLGKSRLIDEFTRRLGDGASVLLAHCDAAGGATFAPLVEALRGGLRIDAATSGDALQAAIETALVGDEPDRARIASGIAALLAGTPASPEESFFVVRRLLAALAGVRPVVLAIDDIQWAEPLLLDLIEHLVQWGSGVRLLVLAAARPELRDTRSSLATPGGLVSDVVTLAGLDAGAATRLAANVIGAADLPAAVAAKVLATSEGNPLFVAELVRMLVHDGALKQEGDRWTAGVQLAGIEMPPTIQALLAARIERLRPEERTVLERAAVIGRHFSRAALAQLLPREITDLDARLESLRRSELIEPDTGWFLGEPVLRFHHVLIRDAAYRRLLKNTRAELHGRFADWLEARAPGAVEHDETLGWHLEQAHQLLLELGPIDAQGRALGERAASHLAAAGRRALARDDLTPAASLLERALARLDAADPARADLTLDWCEALLSAGGVGSAVRAIAELGRFTQDSDRLRAWHTCFTGQLAVLTDPKALRASAAAVEAAAATLTSAGDAAGEAKAHSVHALVLAQLGKIGACEAALDKALAAARRAQDRRRSNAVLSGAPVAALWGPSPVTRASGRCLDVVRVLRITQGAPAVEAVALRCQAVLETLRGRAEAARRMIASSRRMVEELGITQRVLEADLFAGLIELLEGDAATAERCLRVAYDGLRAQGLGIDAAQAAALLGRALLAQGRIAEAEAISVESESLAGDSFKAAIAWRGVRAEALAARGEHAAAIEFARAAVEIAAATDDLLDHADARQALAVALRAAGRSAEAGVEEKRAIELWEAKGATLLADRARRGAQRSIEAPRLPEPSAAPAQTVLRRVLPNAATAAMARNAAAVEARDAEAVAAGHTDAAEYVDHASGASYGREGLLVSLRSLSKARDLIFQHEPLAVLGNSLALSRRFSSSSGVTSPTFEIGAYDREALNLFEVDGESLVRRIEMFAPARLGDAIARLYERYAELLPDGPARTRAAATARSVATLPGSPSRWPFAPDVEATDHRTVGWGSVHGADAVVRAIRTLPQLSDDLANRIDDVLALRSDALLVRWTNSGTDRASGGAFERNLCELWVFGADGLLARWEQFDAEHDAEALARFDELTAEPPRPARRVRPNAATAQTARLDAAIAARDADALTTVLSNESDVVDYTTGTTWDRPGALFTLRSLLSARDPTSRHESLATLGDSLALCRWSFSASGFAGRTLDVGAYQRDNIGLIEADEQGRRRRLEQFGPDHLGDAIARLYERYAELLPDGPARTRAAATARSVAAMLTQRPELDGWTSRFAPDIEHIDHRTVGFGGVLGGHEFRAALATLFELADDVATRINDITELRSDALLLRWTNFGTQRVGGGAYERPFLWLALIGADGFLSRIELFDPDRDAEALARFDELTAEPPPTGLTKTPSDAAQRLDRRVRPNAAIANAARLGAVIAAKDADALPALFADSYAVEDHQTGVAYGLQATLASFRSTFRFQELRYRQEPLATLGDSLALLRESSSGVSGGKLDAGAFELERIILLEVDAQGRDRRAEIFATNRLGDAVARLYDRYAELLPDGPARTRAAASARSVAALLGPFDPDGYAAANAPAVEAVDHRILGSWSASGADTRLQHYRSLLEVADDIVIRTDEVLSLQTDALLVRQTHLGTERAGGGAYERPYIWLGVFGPEGLMTRQELFDSDRDAEALARFDALSAEPPAARFANASSRSMDRLARCWRERDWDGVVATLAPTHRVDDRRRLVGLTMSAEENLANLRFVFAIPGSQWHDELLATRGERLALFRVLVTGQAAADSGPASEEHLQVMEVDNDGRYIAIVLFDLDDLDAAYSELDARFLAGEAAPHAGTWEAAQRFSRVLSERDWEQSTSAFSEDFVLEDHRPLGWGVRSRDELVEQTRALVELAPDVKIRSDHTLAINRRGMLSIGGWVGSRDGGPFEILMLSVMVPGPDGRIRRTHTYDLDQLDAARACFDALTAEPPARLIENAATRQADRFIAVWAARDWKRLTELFPAGFRYIDRKRTTQIGELDRDQWFEWMHPLFEMSSSRLVQGMLATRGDRLALARQRVEVADHDVGPSEIESLGIIEVDERGERVVTVLFDLDDIDAAYAELDVRYHAGEAAPHARVAEGMRKFSRAFASRDWDALAARCAPDLVVYDHRLLGWETLHGPPAYIEALRSLIELAPDTKLRLDHVTLCADGYLVITVWEGTREGGAYEAPSLMVAELDVLGRIRRFDQYDLERLDQARARFAELRPDPLRIPPNAATRASDRNQQILEAHDWDALARLTAPTMVMDDRRRGIRVSGDRDMYLASTRIVAGAARMSRRLLATAGERLALQRVLWTGEVDGAAFESEVLSILEIDADDRSVAIIAFDPDDRRAASAELRERFARSDAAREIPAASFELTRSLNAHDLSRLRTVVRDDFVFDDHRRTGLGRLESAGDYLASVAALFEQTPDGGIEDLYYVAVEKHAHFVVTRMSGVLAEGGEFESVFLRITWHPGGELAAIELFELEDVERARARFEALRPQSVARAD